MRTEDGSIIYECLNGEPGAFGVLVDKYKEGIYAFAYDKLRNFHDAQDVTQEVFLEAYRDLRSLRRWESFAFWLYRIAYMRCKMWMRTQSRRVDQDFIEDQEPEVLDKPSLDNYRYSRIDGLLQEALDSLSGTYREVLMLHYFGGMTIKDIARATGASPGAIGARLSRARAKLREEIVAMMGTVLEKRKLPMGFTFRVVEAIKRIKMHPVSQPRGLPWGISVATGLLATVLSLGHYPIAFNTPEAPAGSSFPGESKLMEAGDMPVDVLRSSVLSQHGSGDGAGEHGRMPLQNAPFMAPQGQYATAGQDKQNGVSLAPAGGQEYTFVRSWPEEILGLRRPEGVAGDSSGNVYVTDRGNHRIQKFDSNGNLLMKWGAFGSGDGQFEVPRGITVDKAGEIYVADSYNYRIQKFDSDGKFLMKWGKEGAGDGQFKWPEGITTDSAGNVYVADYGNCRIQKFDSDGKFLMKWGSEGSGNGQFKWPIGITIDGVGNVYVTDSYNYRIQKFNSGGKFLMKWGSEGSGDGQFLYPQGITTDSARNVYVTDSNNRRIQKFDSGGKFLMKWGTRGTGDGQFQWPYGITTDSAGNVYVTDSWNCRIQKFDPDGKYLAMLGTEGTADGQFQLPVGVAVDNSGDVYVVEEDSHRVQKFDSKGNFLTKWGTYGQGNGQFNWPGGITTDSEGNVYVADSGNSRIQIFDPDGKFLGKWGSQGQGDGQFFTPYDISIDGSGNFYVTDKSYNRIQKFNSRCRFLLKWGTQGSGNGQFNQPTGVVVDTSGDVYVADSGNHRIQKFDSEGNFLMKWGTEGSGDGQFKGPYRIAADSAGDIYVVDIQNHRIQEFDSKGKFLAKWGTYGTGDMEFAWPYDIAIGSSGYIYVADPSNSRIKVYRQIGGQGLEPSNKQPATWGQAKRTELYQNYPNPFNPETWIPFSLSESEHVTIRIYSSAGQLVRTLDLGQKPSGAYLAKEKAAYWDGRNEDGEIAASDVYFYAMEAGEFTDLKKMVIAH